MSSTNENQHDEPMQSAIPEEDTPYTHEDLMGMTKEQLVELVESWQQSITANTVELDLNGVPGFVQRAVNSARRREYIIMTRLMRREFQCQQAEKDLNDIRSTLGDSQMSHAYLDPVANGLFSALTTQLSETQKRLRYFQQELLANQFSPEHEMGKMLISKAKALIAENEQLLKEKDQHDSLTKQLNDQLRYERNRAAKYQKNNAECEELLVKQDEQLEQMKTIIMHLKNRIAELESGQNTSKVLESLKQSSDPTLAFFAAFDLPCNTNKA